MQQPNSRFRSFPQALLSFGGNVILTSLVISGLLIVMRQAGILEQLELGAYDQLMRSRPEEKPDPRFLVVGISEADIQKRKEYPIHDGTLADLLAKLEAQEPRAIGVDVIRDVPQGPKEGRTKLEKILSESDRIVTVCKLSSPDNPGVPPAPGISEDRIGAADLPLDPGGTLRRSILISTPKKFDGPLPVEHICNEPNPDNQIVSLSLQMVVRYLQQQEQPIQPEQTENGLLKFGSLTLKRLEPTSGGYIKAADTADYQLLINYRSNQNSVKIVSLSDVLENRVPTADIKDKVVLVGYTSQQAKDDFYTPYSAGFKDNQKIPGVVIHAQNASQILAAVLDNRPLFWFWEDWQEGLWILGWTVIGASLAWLFRNPWLLVITGGLSVAVLIGGSFFIFTQAGWIPLVPPLFGVFGSATVVLLVDRYAATIVKTVKGFLKINVDIDEGKKEEEVAAIVDSDYFLDLQDKIQGLRTKGETREASSTPKKPFIARSDENYISDTPQPRRGRNNAPIPLDVDYLEQVRERRRQRENPEEAANGDELELANSAELTQDDLGYIEKLQQRGKQLKGGKNK